MFEVPCPIKLKLCMFSFFFITAIAGLWVVVHDIRAQAAQRRENNALERSKCQSLYDANHCGYRPPALSDACHEWLECLRQDVEAVNHLELLAMYAADACDTFIRGIHPS
ncbi:Brl1/Brr6 domain-containing protein [Ephemerocybe angulata]|uniref:Brl1/Brr6 domain-containing protein n=1 Tax=Ephemerocybe angulata TaxID=980116 RepID=A0A8H6H7E2_9AGAR|nr:Brl1/Brr6 domain-containing protein [Tulosesus angulatus]